MTEGSSLLARMRGWREDPRVVRVLQTSGGRLVLALLDLSVRDRALALAGQAFIALVPLVIVLATWLSADDGRAIGRWLVDRFSLQDSTAAAVDQLFARPPETTSGVSLLGVAILMISVNSFARTLQRTYELAWELPPHGRRRGPNRFGSLVLLSALLFTLAWLTGAVRQLPVGAVLAVPVQLVVAVPVWVWIADLLLSHRVPWRQLVPGAAISAVAQVMSTWAGALWVPHLIERNAERYGVVGVAVALISWLVVLAFAVVACATAGAWAGRTFLVTRPDSSSATGGRASGPR